MSVYNTNILLYTLKKMITVQTIFGQRTFAQLRQI